MRLPETFRAVAPLLAALALSGCAEGGVAGNLRAAGVGRVPDEFMVLPTKPLEMPSDLAALPPPTPGASNRVDYQPRAEAVASLTGRTGLAGVTSSPALVARAGPADPSIRADLAVADAAWRQNNRGKLIPRLILRNDEELIYGGMILDPAAAFEQLRARGVGVPPAPPTVLAE